MALFLTIVSFQPPLWLLYLSGVLFFIPFSCIASICIPPSWYLENKDTYKTVWDPVHPADTSHFLMETCLLLIVIGLSQYWVPELGSCYLKDPVIGALVHEISTHKTIVYGIAGVFFAMYLRDRVRRRNSVWESRETEIILRYKVKALLSCVEQTNSIKLKEWGLIVRDVILRNQVVYRSSRWEEFEKALLMEKLEMAVKLLSD